MTYVLYRIDAGRIVCMKTRIDTMHDIHAALAHIHADGYDYVQAEEDDDHPNYWDIFATSKDGRADVFTVEPVSQTQPTAPKGWDSVEGGPTND